MNQKLAIPFCLGARVREVARTSGFAALLCLSVAIPSLAATESRAFRVTFPANLGEHPVRLANLAGHVEILPGNSAETVVETVLFAEGKNDSETQALLSGTKWVKGHDSKGREEWALSYPVEKYRAFRYPDPRRKDDSEFLGFFDGSSCNGQYRGEKVRVYSGKKLGVPTLYANVRVRLPKESRLVFRNLVGDVDAGNLEGDLVLDTGSGDVEVAGFNGRLLIDTGSGDVRVGTTRGETSIDTGSGDVAVARLIGNGSIDTGSGNVRVDSVSAGKLSIDTGSGDVSVKNGSAGRLLADTGSGGVEVLGVEIEELVADTGSGDVSVHSSLAQARRVSIDTGSGDVVIRAGAKASFDIASDQGSGELTVGYADAALRKEGRKVIGARRGNGQTVIRVETGSGDCVLQPQI